MEPLLTVTALDKDDDYLGIDIFVSNTRFAGSSFIYAGLDDVGHFADCLEGFPSSPRDERVFQLGSKSHSLASGFVGFVFRTVGELGQSELEIEIVDSEVRYTGETAAFTLPVEAAGIDRFVLGLRAIQSSRVGTATLSASS